jgi:GntR family transcriptional regulator, rspAB operon transcriptional repressor
VRIAVTRLAEDGLIDIFPQRGTYVAPIKLKDVRECQFARTALEIALVEEAALHWTESHAARIRSDIDSQRKHAAGGGVRGDAGPSPLRLQRHSAAAAAPRGLLRRGVRRGGLP